ncbi:MAG: hypothetical protein O2816_11270 [Planctomycetota bacterium]|nr:hypothetical protein [Planctomycetota bacterium]
MPPHQLRYCLVSQTQGFTANPAGSQGNFCLHGSVGRYNGDGQSSGAAGGFSLQLDLGDRPGPVQDMVTGESWFFTTWHRDVGQRNNFTGGVRIDFLSNEPRRCRAGRLGV